MTVVGDGERHHGCGTRLETVLVQELASGGDFLGRGMAKTTIARLIDHRAQIGSEAYGDRQPVFEPGVEATHQHWETPPGAGQGAGDCPAGTTARGLRSPRDEKAKAIYAASAAGAGSLAARWRWTRAISSLRSAAFRRPPERSSIFRATAMLGRREPFSISYAWARLFSPSAAAKAS